MGDVSATTFLDSDELSDVLFFTCATGFYENFVLPYIYFAETHNKGAKFEIIVSDVQCFMEKHETGIRWMRERGVGVHFRDASSYDARPHIDNSLRFVVEPVTRAKYVYIGDIDIMILEDAAAWHRPIFAAGLPYSNVVRENTKRLSGLHFTIYDAYYPLPDIADLIASTANDEELLYKIVERKGVLYPNDSYYAIRKLRPIHGPHMSMNRLPFSDGDERPGWSITFKQAEACRSIFKSDEFSSFFDALHRGSRTVIANLIYLAEGICALGEPAFDAIGARHKPILKPSGNERVFTDIYESNSWKSAESRSGPSSTLARTADLRAALPKLFAEFGVKRVFDAPCGDMNWMQHVLKDCDISYIGGDIVLPLIEANIKSHGGDSRRFIHIDLLASAFPAADMMIARDFMFHLSYDDTRRFLRQLIDSDIDYLLTTTHIAGMDHANKDIATGGWRMMDLFAAPYNFPLDCLRMIPDGGDRYMCLWSKQQIADAYHAWREPESQTV